MGIYPIPDELTVRPEYHGCSGRLTKDMPEVYPVYSHGRFPPVNQRGSI